MVVVSHENQLIKDLRKGDQKAFEQVYQQYWPVIAHFVWLNQGRKEEAEDLFQDGVVILYGKLRDERFQLQHSLKTYLYSICRYQWLKQRRGKKGITIVEVDEYLESVPQLVEEESDLPNDQVLFQAIENLKDPCYTLLVGYYYERLNLEQLAGRLNYAGANVAKQRKFRCLERLKKALLQQTDRGKAV